MTLDGINKSIDNEMPLPGGFIGIYGPLSREVIIEDQFYEFNNRTLEEGIRSENLIKEIKDFVSRL
jgi:hypothetical protein